MKFLIVNGNLVFPKILAKLPILPNLYLKQCSAKNVVNLKELLESMKYLKTLGTKEQWRYSIELLKISLPQQKTTKKKNNLKESSMTFWYTITIESIRLRRRLHSKQWEYLEKRFDL